MALNLKAVLGTLKSTRTISDPWGLGWTFTIRRKDSREYQTWLRDSFSNNPINRQATTALARASFRKMASPDAKISDKELQSQALMEVAEKFEVDEDTIDAFYGSQAEGIAKLITHFSGIEDDKGKPVAYNDANLKDLLTDTTMLPAEDAEGNEYLYGNQPLGVALQEFIGDEADLMSAFRDDVVEEAAKNSEKS